MQFLLRFSKFQTGSRLRRLNRVEIASDLHARYWSCNRDPHKSCFDLRHRNRLCKRACWMSFAAILFFSCVRACCRVSNILAPQQRSTQKLLGNISLFPMIPHGRVRAFVAYRHVIFGNRINLRILFAKKIQNTINTFEYVVSVFCRSVWPHSY